LTGIQISDPLWWESIFLAIRCNQELAGQILSKSKVPRFSSEFSSEFQLIEVPRILVQIHFESKGISLTKVVPHVELFPAIFLFGIFGAG
jgi:hypothetical protein